MWVDNKTSAKRVRDPLLRRLELTFQECSHKNPQISGGHKVDHGCNSLCEANQFLTCNKSEYDPLLYRLPL